MTLTTVTEGLKVELLRAMSPMLHGVKTANDKEGVVTRHKNTIHSTISPRKFGSDTFE